MIKNSSGFENDPEENASTAEGLKSAICAAWDTQP
jgi:hypothetical protein